MVEISIVAGQFLFFFEILTQLLVCAVSGQVVDPSSFLGGLGPLNVAGTAAINLVHSIPRTAILDHLLYKWCLSIGL